MAVRPGHGNRQPAVRPVYEARSSLRFPIIWKAVSNRRWNNQTAPDDVWTHGSIGPDLDYSVLRWFEHHQIYRPSTVMDAEGIELGRPYEDVFFRTLDGVRLNAWFFPAERNSRRAHLAFLICHGNSGNISHRLPHCAALLETGANVLVFDYRGYGRSEGRPDEQGTYRDAQAAWQWLKQKGFDPSGIIALGESLGGGVACELATREPLGGLILQATFTSALDLGTELFPWLPVRRLGRIHYDTRGKLSRVTVPVMIIHSREDRVIPFHHAEQNFAAARGPKMMWEISGAHNDFVKADRKRYLAGVDRFLDQVGMAGSPPH